MIGCSRYFAGGSASTPTLRADGTRSYFGDNDGNLIALDASCNEAWTLDVGSQIVGSVAVASDDDEIYAATQTSIVQIIDDGTSAHLGWTANLDVYAPGAADQHNFNLLLASVGANGVGFMAGAGIPPGVLAGIGLPLTVGYGVLDRATGAVRYFADGLDESVAELDVGPDGAYYNANSPVRRAFAHAVFPDLTPPIEGGIRKYKPIRSDLLIRDGVCAARDRVQNALAFGSTCGDSAAADATQVAELIAQARRAGPRAIAEGTLSPTRWGRIDASLTDASGGGLATAAPALERACAIAAPCPPDPRAGCRSAGKSKLRLKQRPGKNPNGDLLRWSWTKGQATSVADFADPTDAADYGVCVYAGTAGSEALVYQAGVPASPSRWATRARGFTYTDRSRDERGMWRIALKSGASTKSAVDVRAEGAAFSPGLFPLAPPVTAQLVNLESGACWESRFESGSVLTNDDDELKAKTSS